MCEGQTNLGLGWEFAGDRAASKPTRMTGSSTGSWELLPGIEEDARPTGGPTMTAANRWRDDSRPSTSGRSSDPSFSTGSTTARNRSPQGLIAGSARSPGPQ